MASPSLIDPLATPDGAPTQPLSWPEFDRWQAATESIRQRKAQHPQHHTDKCQHRPGFQYPPVKPGVGYEGPHHGRIHRAVERMLDALLAGYRRGLDLVLRHRFVTLMSFFAEPTGSGPKRGLPFLASS